MADSFRKQKRLVETKVLPEILERTDALMRLMLEDPESLEAELKLTLDEVGRGEHGVAALRLCLSMIASCGEVPVMAREVCDRSGRVRTGSPKVLKRLIIQKLYGGEESIVQRFQKDEGATLTNAAVSKVYGVFLVITALAKRVLWTVVSLNGLLAYSVLASARDGVESIAAFLYLILAISGGGVYGAGLTALEYVVGGVKMLVSVRTVAGDLKACAEALLGAERQLRKGGGTAEEEDRRASDRTRAAILANCSDHATMFAVLSPLGEPLTAPQMTKIRQSPQKSKVAAAYGSKRCSLEQPPPGVVVRILSLPGYVLGNLITGR